MSKKDQTIKALLGILERLAEGAPCDQALAMDDPNVLRGCELAGQALDRLERQARQDGVFLASIVENLPAMLFVKDAKDLRFVRFNRAGEELLGLSRAELIGKNDYDFFPKDEADFFTSKDRQVLAGGRSSTSPRSPCTPCTTAFACCTPGRSRSPVRMESPSTCSASPRTSPRASSLERP